MKKRFLLAFLTASALGFFAFKSSNAGDRYFEIAKNLEIFTSVFKELNTGYVDEIDPSKLMRTGIDAMMESLDPYTNYISETDIEGYRILTEGKYNGIGAQSKKMGDWVTIVEIQQGSPADKSGLRVGDQIVSIDGQAAKNRSVEAVMEILRGFPGTEVDLEIQRPLQPKTQKLTLKRDEITVSNVPYSGLVSPEVGYINLTTFTRDAGQHVAEALEKLKKDAPKMHGLILDLRDNGGGLLTEAVNLVNVFVPKSEFIVSMKGKVEDWDRSFKTLNKPVDEALRVVVLIDKMSASASEIVSGSLQDLDRAVLMGQKSYGKGLVQNTREVGYNSKIKLTTAKYYIPSGRCIQAVRYKNGEPIDIPENERGQFKTRAGRIVFDGGGIKPDVFLPKDTATAAVKALVDQNALFNFVSEWTATRPTIDSADVFSFNDWAAFEAFLTKTKFSYESESEKALKTLTKKAEAEKFMASIAPDIKSLEAKIAAEKRAEIQKARAEITRLIEQEIVGRYFYQRGKVKKSLKNDLEIRAAIELLGDEMRYKKLLSKG